MDPMEIAVAVGVIGLVLVSKYNEQITFLLSSEFHQVLFKASLMLVPALLGSALVCLGLVKATQNLLAVRRRLRRLQQDSITYPERVQSLEQENGELRDKLTMEKHEKGKLMNELKQAQEELKELDEVEEEEVNEPTVRVHGDKPLYRVSELSDDEQKFLLQSGFTKHTFVGIDTPGPQTWLLKCSTRESPEHFFLVHHIAEYLRTKAEKVELFETRGPDIVFTGKNGEKVALEIESGSWLKSDKAGFFEKIAELNEKYGKKWAFVVTRKGLKRSYRRYGKVYSRGNIMEVLGGYFW